MIKFIKDYFATMSDEEVLKSFVEEKIRYTKSPYYNRQTYK